MALIPGVEGYLAWTQRPAELSSSELASEVARSVLGSCWSSGDTDSHLEKDLFQQMWLLSPSVKTKQSAIA